NAPPSERAEHHWASRVVLPYPAGAARSTSLAEDWSRKRTRPGRATHSRRTGGACSLDSSGAPAPAPPRAVGEISPEPLPWPELPPTFCAMTDVSRADRFPALSTPVKGIQPVRSWPSKAACRGAPAEFSPGPSLLSTAPIDRCLHPSRVRRERSE